VGRANFARTKYSPRSFVTLFFQILEDSLESEADMAFDVLKEYPSRTHDADVVEDEGPEVPRIVCSSALAGGAEGLARVSAK